MQPHDLKRRVLAGMGANSVGMAITIGTQLGSLPIFLSHWDTTTYGVWLMLSALPGFLSMADVGMVTAAGNRMTMSLGAGDQRMANQLFQSAQVFMLVVCTGLAAVLLPIIWWSPWPATASDDQRMALVALCLGVLAALFAGLSEQVFKSTQRYAFGTMMGNATRLAEWMGWMLGLILVGSFAAVALGGLLFRLAGTLLSVYLARRNAQGLQWGMQHATLKMALELGRPALAFMAFPLASALSLQGVTLVVGGLLGPVAVAIFNTYRTLARTTVQATAIFSHALWPEFARLFGQGAQGHLMRLAWRSTWVSGIQAATASVVLFLLAPWILQVWTHGRIGFDPMVFGLLMLYAAVAGLWHVPRVLLMSTNRHTALALWSVGTGLLCVGLSAALGQTLGLPGVSAAMLISEGCIAIACAWLAWRASPRYASHREALP